MVTLGGIDIQVMLWEPAFQMMLLELSETSRVEEPIRFDPMSPIVRDMGHLGALPLTWSALG